MHRYLLLILLIVGALARPVSALELDYPEDGTLIHNSDYIIIKGGQTPQLESMVIELNGVRSDPIDISSEEYRKAFGDMLILQPEFDPGKNSIRVEGYVAGKMVSEAQGDIYYKENSTEVPPDGYRPFIMHTPQKERLCAACHNMQPDKVELRANTAQGNPCASCHKRMLNKSYVHGPAGVFGCIDCHDPASQPNKYRVAEKNDAQLCNSCHQEQLQAFKSNKFIHGPIEVGMCLICHDPHASEYRSQVVEPINELCLACHSKVKGTPHVTRGVGGKAHPLSGAADPSRPGVELSCTSCHNPHGGMSKGMFQWQLTSRFALCQVCHKK